MSLKCSLLGHRFDETAVERDRQEDGSEVVITITELETCTRCGETRVVSENKEVTTLATPDLDADSAGTDAADVAADTTADADVAADTNADTAEIVDESDATPDAEATAVDETADTTAASDADAGSDVEGDDAEILDAGDPDAGSPDAGGSEGDAQTQARGDSTPIPDAESGDVTPAAGSGAETGVGDPDDDEATDDAVIIDGDTGEERDPGEWPDDDLGEADAGTAGTPSAGADAAETPAGADAGTGAEDDSLAWSGESADADDASSGSPDAAWPAEESDDAGEETPLGEWPAETTRDVPDDDATEQTVERNASSTFTVPEGMYKCPECGFTAEVESSSLRAGDFCPECRRGALVQDGDGAN